MPVRPVPSGSPEVSGPPHDAASWVVEPGDSLCRIARQLQEQGMPGTTAELVRTLVRLNGLTDPDRIEAGRVLSLPPRARRPPIDPQPHVLSLVGRPLHGLEQLGTRLGEQRTRVQTVLLRLLHRVPGEAVPARAADATPRFRQSDPAWRAERLGLRGEGPTLAQAGCAVTACAMALSRIGGRELTPDVLLRHLRSSGGFQGPLLDWSAAGSAIPGGPRAAPGDLDCARIDSELDAGRPVLLRVVHEVQGHPRQHWICLTGREPASGRYTANDPATGRTTVLAREGPALASVGGEPVRYASDGRMVSFLPAAGSRA